MSMWSSLRGLATGQGAREPAQEAAEQARNAASASTISLDDSKVSKLRSKLRDTVTEREALDERIRTLRTELRFCETSREALLDMEALHHLLLTSHSSCCHLDEVPLLRRSQQLESVNPGLCKIHARSKEREEMPKSPKKKRERNRTSSSSRSQLECKQQSPDTLGGLGRGSGGNHVGFTWGELEVTGQAGDQQCQCPAANQGACGREQVAQSPEGSTRCETETDAKGVVRSADSGPQNGEGEEQEPTSQQGFTSPQGEAIPSFTMEGEEMTAYEVVTDGEADIVYELVGDDITDVYENNFEVANTFFKELHTPETRPSGKGKWADLLEDEMEMRPFKELPPEWPFKFKEFVPGEEWLTAPVETGGKADSSKSKYWLTAPVDTGGKADSSNSCGGIGDLGGDGGESGFNDEKEEFDAKAADANQDAHPILNSFGKESDDSDFDWCFNGIVGPWSIGEDEFLGGVARDASPAARPWRSPWSKDAWEDASEKEGGEVQEASSAARPWCTPWSKDAWEDEKEGGEVQEASSAARPWYPPWSKDAWEDEQAERIQKRKDLLEMAKNIDNKEDVQEFLRQLATLRTGAEEAASRRRPSSETADEECPEVWISREVAEMEEACKPLSAELTSLDDFCGAQASPAAPASAPSRASLLGRSLRTPRSAGRSPRARTPRAASPRRVRGDLERPMARYEPTAGLAVAAPASCAAQEWEDSLSKDTATCSLCGLRFPLDADMIEMHSKQCSQRQRMASAAVAPSQIEQLSPNSQSSRNRNRSISKLGEDPGPAKVQPGAMRRSQSWSLPETSSARRWSLLDVPMNWATGGGGRTNS